MLPKTILITGTTSGIGLETTLALAKQGHHIYMLVRDKAKGEDLRLRLIAESKNRRIHVVECDLTDLESVRRAMWHFERTLVSINVLINNAGGVFGERELSSQGYEKTFALNHLGHFLLTMGLMPLLERGQARVICLSSEAHRIAKPNLDDLQMEANYSAIGAYANVKLFNIWFAKAIAQRYAAKGVSAYSLHPGAVNTAFGHNFKGAIRVMLNIMRPLMISPAKGARTPVYLATQPGIEGLSGMYFKNRRVVRPSAMANHVDNCNRLWQASEQMVAGYLHQTI